MDKKPSGLICQSCSMPMQKPEDFGTNADKSRNTEYCRYCFQGGKFTNPNLDLHGMIDRLAKMAPMMGKTEADARKTAQTVLPKLKRWKR